MPECFKFDNLVYRMTSLIDECVIDPISILEIDWEHPDVVRKICKFSKASILYEYIFSMISVFVRREFLKNADLYEENEIAGIEATFQEYEIKILPFYVFYEKKKGDFEDFDVIFYKWFCDQESQFVKLWEVISEEVFHLLFANRRFLLNFNQSIANCLSDGKIKIPNDCQGDNKHIKRDRYIPTWVKKAVFYRDHGRCVICQKDLTGLICTDISLHYDHIVPLNQWGINDPSNMQLLCNKCNLRKSGNAAFTGIKYPTWW